jgi:L-lactate dehydrogenase complex protein LldF
MAAASLRIGARGKGRMKSLPFAGGWTGGRDFPAPQGKTFMDQWKAARK